MIATIRISEILESTAGREMVKTNFNIKWHQHTVSFISSGD